jgi:hypothetical protein
MIRLAKTWGAGLAFSAIVGTACAAEECARAADFTALQVSALQQQLMVAALTCNDAALYNRFVVAHRPELIAYDYELKRFFERFGDGEGASRYHTFKTKMANLYSARSSDDRKTFCTTVRASFTAALDRGKKDLVSFARSQPSILDETYTNCGVSVAGAAGQAGSQAAGAPLHGVPASSATAASANSTGAVDRAANSSAQVPARAVGRDGFSGSRSERVRRSARSPLSGYCRSQTGWRWCDWSADRYDYGSTPYPYENTSPDHGRPTRSQGRGFPQRRLFR